VIRWLIAVVMGLALLAFAPALYYRASNGAGCASSCHEITDAYNQWRNSTHRNIPCCACHENEELANARRLVLHARDDVPEQIRIKGIDVAAMAERCRNCHRQEFAEWQAGPHGSNFAAIFLDQKHNRETKPRDDCFRCHGSYYEGGIQQLMSEIGAKQWATQPAMPCFACHQVHRRGEPLGNARFSRSHGLKGGGSAHEELQRPSIAFFDRRGMSHIPLADLPMPAMLDGARAVRISPDQRQALCYQCHAPLATRQVGSGDDRTGMGVHEGISCLACHEKHGQRTRASCATCHPRLSNCGLDVEKMDTTFASATSKHNIHFVKCADCHTKGVPKRPTQQAQTRKPSTHG